MCQNINYEERYRALLGRHKLLVEKTRIMRNLQKEYFRTRSTPNLGAARFYEQEVDHLLLDDGYGATQPLFDQEGGSR
jgi:hypothetical protein